MKRSTSGLFIILLFLLSSCGGGITKNDQSNNPPSVEQETLEKRDTPSELIELDESYNYYISRINNGLLEFRDLVYNLDYSTLIIENRSVWGISTEGAQLTRFMTSESNVLRYTFDVFGEGGRTAQNYFSPPFFNILCRTTPVSIEKTRKRSVYGGFWLELLSGLEPETSSLPRTRSTD